MSSDALQTMPIPQVVIFDLGKVLLDFDYRIAARTLAARARMVSEEISKLIDQSPLLLRYEAGLMTQQDFYESLCAGTGYSGGIHEFAEAFGDIFTPIEPMVQLHAELRRQAVPTYVLSNTNDLAIAHIRRSFPFFNQFDGYVLSYEHRAMKPEPKIYEVAERLCGRKQAEILYIDDREENLSAARERGWQVILQRTPAETRQAMTKLGLVSE